MRSRLIFQRNGHEQQQELSGFGLTIGRGHACDLRIDDGRISTQHCRLSLLEGEWFVHDLKSANRTFLNEELVLERPRRLADGDTLRLGSSDDPLFVARFVIHDQPTESSLPAPPVDRAISQKLTALEAALQERDTELARMRVLCKQLQARLNESETREVVDAVHSNTSMSKLDALHEELRESRDGYAAFREELSLVQSRCEELDKQLVEERRRAQSCLSESERGRERSEHELSRARSELAAARKELAVARANIDTIKSAHDELLARLSAYEDLRQV